MSLSLSFSCLHHSYGLHGLKVWKEINTPCVILYQWLIVKNSGNSSRWRKNKISRWVRWLRFSFQPSMKRWFKNQNKTVCALENISHTSSHVLKMADKINEKLLFPLIILQAQETVKDLETCCFYPWCSPGLYSRTPAASDTFHREIPAGVSVCCVTK